MKRNKFIQSILATLVIPSTAFAHAKNKIQRTDKGFKVPAGEGRIHGHIQLKGVNSNILDVKISGTDTDGSLAVFEQTSLSQGKGTPLHVHHFQDEVFYVVEGDYYFMVGEEKFRLKKGDSIFLPRKVPHAWTQVSDQGKMTVLFQPAGKMESFFVSLAAYKTIPTKEQMAQLFTDNEMEIVGPPLQLA
jgi:quercetin dioxygenase-like cupin family protein